MNNPSKQLSFDSVNDAFIMTFLSFSGRIISAILWTPVCRRSPRTDLPLMCCSRYKTSKEVFDVVDSHIVNGVGFMVKQK